MDIENKGPAKPPSQHGVARRDFLKASLVGAAGVTVASSIAKEAFSLTESSSSRRPNILYIHSHDTGRFTSPYGYQVPTPNLQRLASKGIVFRQAFCAAPTCSPSRASLLTGACPHSNGMLGLAHRGFALNDYRQHIIHTLRREAGYRSTLIGLQHIANDPHVIGYDQVRVIPGNRVEHVTPAAVQFLSSKPRQPFWLTAGYFETHREYRKAEAEDNWRYNQPPHPIPDVPTTRRDMADFHATVRKLDAGVGEVLTALEAAGLAENTLVISTTDHGTSFPNMKCNLYDGGMGVHMVLRGPGPFLGGKACDAMISQLDLYPTLCDWLRIPPPKWLQGRSFLPVLRGEVSEINEAVFSEVNYHAAYEPKRAVRTKELKYIRHYGNYNHPVLPNCDNGLSKTLWVENGWAKQIVPREELYNLIFDPNEQNNLIADSSSRSTLEQLRKRMDEWMITTNDPLLHGPVKAPSGARVTPMDAVSPNDNMYIAP